MEFEYSFEFEWPKRSTLWKEVNEVIQLLTSLCYFFIILILVTFDCISWIAVTIFGAGNMIVDGLYEAY